MKATKAQFTAYVLVRNAEGQPKFDDIYHIPIELWDSLADHEKHAIESEILKRKQRGEFNTAYP